VYPLLKPFVNGHLLHATEEVDDDVAQGGARKLA
jgi:hypothetical protein